MDNDELTQHIREHMGELFKDCDLEIKEEFIAGSAFRIVKICRGKGKGKREVAGFQLNSDLVANPEELANQLRLFRVKFAMAERDN